MATASPFDLEEILKEAKAAAKKSAEQKRLEGLEQIRALTWKNEGGVEPLDVFPREMWIKILSYLDSPLDLENARLSCPLFAAILEPRRLSDILLPQVLQLNEFQRLLQLTTPYKPRRHRFFCFIGPHEKTHPYLHILSLRSVCKSWRNQVDRFLEQNLNKSLMSLHDSTYFPYLRIGSSTFPGQNNQLPKSFAELCQASGNVRFISRSIHVDLQVLETRDPDPMAYENRMQEFSSRLLKLLEVVGSQVWDFQFQPAPLSVMFGNCVVLCDLYQHLISWIGLMPNLKYLDIIFSGPKTVKDDERALREAIERQPFPYLAKLKKLSLCCDQSFLNAGGHSILVSIFTSCQHLQHLRICTGNERLSGLINSLNLETLSVSTHPDGLSQVNNIRDMMNFRWPLKELRLGFNDFHGDVEMSSVFAMLEEFKALEKLKLDLSEQNLVGVERTLRLPELKEFAIELSGDAQRPNNPFYTYSIDYLLGCRNLRKIIWLSDDVVEQTQSFGRFNEELRGIELVKFQTEMANMHSSNSKIFNLFPFLEELTVRCIDGRRMDQLNRVIMQVENGEEARFKIYKRSATYPVIL